MIMNPVKDLDMGERCYYATVGSKYKECDYYSFVYPCFNLFDYETQELMSVMFADIHFKKIIKGDL